MSATFERIRELIASGDVRISEHGYDEMVQDELFVNDILGGVNEGIVVEDYPSYHKGPCVLVLQKDENLSPIHVVWGIPKGSSAPAVLVTAYRPNPAEWTVDFLRRK